MLGNPTLELYLTLALTAAVAAIMGLALSAAATSQDQILPMLVITMMLSIVFGGGMIPVSRSNPARPDVMARARPLGLRRLGVHRRFDYHRSSAADQRQAVVTREPLVASGYDHAGYPRTCDGRIRPMARPAPLDSPITLQHSDFHDATGIAAAPGSPWTIEALCHRRHHEDRILAIVEERGQLHRGHVHSRSRAV